MTWSRTICLVALLAGGFCTAAGAQSVAIENERLAVRVVPDEGSLSVVDKRAGYTWRQAPGGKGPRFRAAAGSGSRLSFEADFGATDGKPNTVAVTISLPETPGDLLIEADMADRGRKIGNLQFLEPLILDTPAGVLAVADYSNGHLYPLDRKPFPRTWFGADRLDMPWVGLCDLVTGIGYCMIIEPSDDAAVQMVACAAGAAGGREVAAPRAIWRPSKGTFAQPRRLLFRFVASGGHVALAKAYRAHAKGQGLLVTLAEKAARNPNLTRLFGAPDVWGNATLGFARAAKAAGVEKMLIHGRSSPEEMRQINELGYLTSEYDNYTDIKPREQGKEIDAQHDDLPGAAVLKADGQRMTAWLTFDKKTQFMKRCPALWLRTAKIVVPRALAKHPFLGRFVDVTTAEGLYECYDQDHPLSNGEKRACGVELLSYVRSLNLVTGGEHGIWWAVPQLDYIEGMMSGGSYSWPAGHLIHPKTKDQEFTSPWGGKLNPWSDYETWGIGHQFRAPLWELVFHDCVVSTWYWGDASDWLRVAAPEITAKKDAFNVLYGTIPLLWANKEGSWEAGRDMFLRSYRVTCKLNEAIAGTEMLSHEFVTANGDVQKTRFSDGTEVIVNFGTTPHATEFGGRSVVLPQNGFWVKGPKIEQHLLLEGGKQVLSIRAGSFSHTEELK